MGLLSIFKRNSDAKPRATAASPSPGSVQQTRARARQRLVGAVILVVIGIIGFPLLFESQPRPIPVDIPIEIPRKDGAAALVMPPARAVAPSPETVVAPAQPVAGDATAARAVPGARGAASGALATSPPEPSEPKPTSKPPVPRPAAQEAIEAPKRPSASVPVAASSPPPAPLADAARAKALLEGKATVTKEGARFVVQVGAFADAAAVQETRAKVEKLGLKTYTQVTETAAGNRIRVRVGPFATREEAERALDRAKAAGVNAVVLPL